MNALQTGPLPKVEGSGRRREGLWPNHEAEARQLQELARRDPQAWAAICTKMKAHAASRVANLINRGLAKDFPITDQGRFEARTRRNSEGKGHDLWARWIPAQ